MGDQLELLFGVVLMAIPAFGISSCSFDRGIALYRFCNLTTVPQVPNSTERLLLSFNYIRTVTSMSFPFLEQLLLLELGSQFTPLTVDKEAFRNLPYLRILDLGYNQIDFLHPDAFQGLPHLFELRLFYCGLSDAVVKDGYFRNLESLTRLDLSKNQIGSLHLHPSFQELNSLKSIDFSFNQVSIVCENELKPLQGKMLSFFSLATNSLYSRVSVDWGKCRNPFRNMTLETLDVSDNGWTAAIIGNFSKAISGSQIFSLVLAHHIMGSGFGFHNIKDPDQNTFAGLARSSVIHLDLSHGYIFSLNFRLFETLKELKVLNLAHNKINKIVEGAFYGLDSLQVLNLSYNLLGELYNYNFNGLPKVSYVDLKQNHIGIIQDQTFRFLEDLNTLDLQDNALKTINFIPSIPSIFLGGNKLVTLPNIKLTANLIQLSENRLENLADLYFLLQVPHLQFLILNQNRLSSCSQRYTPAQNLSLERLFLGENMLQLAWENGFCWDVFKGLSHLQILHLNGNYLNFLPPGVFSDLTALRGLDLSFNRLTVLSPGDLPVNLKILDVSRNQLLSPDPNLFASLSAVDITHNSFVCECELSTFISWLNQTNVTLFGSPEDMSCKFPEVVSGVPLYSVSMEECDEEAALQSLKFSLFIFFTVMLILFLMTVLIVTKFRGFCFLCYKRAQRLVFKDHHKGLEADTTYRYDAYLCFSSKDFEWVQSALLKSLDVQYSDQNRFSLCFEERDFVPGENHLVNIQDAIWSSRKVVCLVSRHFLQDGWCLEAFTYAQGRCLSDLNSVLIMVVVGSLSQYQLMKHQPIRGFIQKQQYLRWPEDLQDVDWFLDKLSQQILKKEKEKKRANSIVLQTVTTIS
ncbi:toll-like receptor 5 [Elephas maximus indicus]|uniref:toll-like receptor 5 n=1 Tax=Elephas maximus indicus TaxID=99487 RepID=UPI0021165D10|nr:toll-like receptor 5 [Elephas maximus indicus]XP_049723978.1 toll-like receptor 5 [Elephas maximus indicus]XP_049723979.1 toll-like receptor 5 [Elephas maximus indicus]XP_049723980.1 toll-like receptor 5 [Elephas maximus indicus]XP_049723981.1 toll-like receptor 5 [Elephas maximus indicus]XP_049723982.1 toll-like receptor 5 [Elephas maximus indicus]XP_049723983.1 toll-like receptor 5 [Elephas maximus indicus]XP_049723984.1 toll-like receptor 5 [Elephas maximus indicus]XP_049723985.1 toll